MIYYWTRPEVAEFSHSKKLGLKQDASEDGSSHFSSIMMSTLRERVQILFAPYFEDKKIKDEDVAATCSSIPPESREALEGEHKASDVNTSNAEPFSDSGRVSCRPQ